MNKIFRLATSANSGDKEIAKILLVKDRSTKQHFYNIALYLGPRSGPSTHKLFLSGKWKSWELYSYVSNPLSPYLQAKLRKQWEIANVGFITVQRGFAFEKAKKSYKILMDE